MNQTTTDKLLDLLRVVVEKVNTNANNINKLAEEIKKLKTRAKKLKANCLVTTEKDWIKLFRWEEVIDFILPITINVQWLKNSEKVIFERLKGLTI